jgi:N-acetyl-anhydromuramyl-L-alanine amidase AmpD
MRDIKYIVIHEAACPLHKPDGKQFTITDVDQWHVERGFKRSATWKDIWHPELKAVGYHFVIGIDGQVWEGRHQDEIPAAVQGFNTVSINICLIGQGKYTSAQWDALRFLVSNLEEKYPKAELVGHYHSVFNSHKSCPDFDVTAWSAGEMKPLEGHIA